MKVFLLMATLLLTGCYGQKNTEPTFVFLYKGLSNETPSKKVLYGHKKKNKLVVLLEPKGNGVCHARTSENELVSDIIYSNLPINHIQGCSSSHSRIGMMGAPGKIDYSSLPISIVTVTDQKEIDSLVKQRIGFSRKDSFKIESPYRLYFINGNRPEAGSYLIFKDKIFEYEYRRTVVAYFKLNGFYFVLINENGTESCKKNTSLYKVTEDGLELVLRDEGLNI